jgi:hypothetical protein
VAHQERFDELAKGLATNRLSRGQVFKGLAASLLVGGAFSALSDKHAEAQDTDKWAEWVRADKVLGTFSVNRHAEYTDNDPPGYEHSVYDEGYTGKLELQLRQVLGKGTKNEQRFYSAKGPRTGSYSVQSTWNSPSGNEGDCSFNEMGSGDHILDPRHTETWADLEVMPRRGVYAFHVWQIKVRTNYTYSACDGRPEDSGTYDEWIAGIQDQDEPPLPPGAPDWYGDGSNQKGYRPLPEGASISESKTTNNEYSPLPVPYQTSYSWALSPEVTDPPTRRVKIWINAFIPHDLYESDGVTPYTRPYPKDSNMTMFEGPTSANDCFLTDQRSFSSDPLAKSRMHSEVTVELGKNPKIVGQQKHKCSPTTEVDCEDGDVECTKSGSVTGDKFYNLKKVQENIFRLNYEAAASNPCFRGSPKINIEEGKITFQLSEEADTVAVSFNGLIEPFPAFEMYAAPEGGSPQALFQVLPKSGLGPGRLWGRATKRMKGSVVLSF